MTWSPDPDRAPVHDSAEEPPMTATLTRTEKPTSATLYFGPWYRRSPFFEKTL